MGGAGRVAGPAAGRTSAPAAVHASGWGWRHAGRRDWAVRDLQLEIEPGERVLLLGASGSGKSTLLAALAGVLGGEDEGEEQGLLRVDGADPARHRGRSGLLLQDPDAQVVLARLGDDVAFGCENLGVPRAEIWPRVREALGAVGLSLPLDHPTTQLSGGQKQRLALAGVMAMRPGLLLLDEPTANLDPDGVVQVRDAVAAVLEATGATLVVVEHRVDVWQGLVDRVIVLGDDHGILADGAPETVLHAEAARLRGSGVWLPGDRPQSVSVADGTPRVPLLQARELAIARGRGPAVASGLELDVTAGTTTVITGPNGAGKSTLALTLGGLIPPLAGTVTATAALAGPAGEAPIRWRSRDLLTRIGSVFQNPEHQFVAATVRQELAIGPRALRLPHEEIAARVDELLARLRLAELAEANPFTLSGGQKRRLSVATTLATRPRLLIFDEPTFGQDAVTWRELIAMFRELQAEGHALVAVSHDADFARATGASQWRLTAALERQPA
ncbi:MAG: ABC transporter ATP-binding protein [Microbacteriaceae bacterium]|nr:MAG: ABC transporter ATP-binding protein [Microbacteriaceae bacterium]